MPAVHRLGAILPADVAGYSRLMGIKIRGAGSSAAPLAISVFLGLQSSRSDATFQASKFDCVGWGAVNPGGVYSEATPWKLRPPLLITKTYVWTPCEVPGGTPGML